MTTKNITIDKLNEFNYLLNECDYMSLCDCMEAFGQDIKRIALCTFDNGTVFFCFEFKDGIQGTNEHTFLDHFFHSWGKETYPAAISERNVLLPDFERYIDENELTELDGKYPNAYKVFTSCNVAAALLPF